jgi:hypothetical protein
LLRRRFRVREIKNPKGDTHKQANDNKAAPCGFQEGDSAYIGNQVILGKNQKFANRWFGPYKATDVICEQKIELEKSPRKTQIHYVYTIKKFVDPEMSKFESKNKFQRTLPQSQPEIKRRGVLKNLVLIAAMHSTKDAAAKSIEQRVTRQRNKHLLTKKQEMQAINSINTLMIPEV